MKSSKVFTQVYLARTVWGLFYHLYSPSGSVLSLLRRMKLRSCIVFLCAMATVKQKSCYVKWASLYITLSLAVPVAGLGSALPHGWMPGNSHVCVWFFFFLQKNSLTMVGSVSRGWIAIKKNKTHQFYSSKGKKNQSLWHVPHLAQRTIP